MKDKKNIIRIAVILAAVAAITLSVAAEFTKSYRAKRVIAANPSEGMLFSSNYLLDTPEIPTCTVWVDKHEAEHGSIPSFDVVVTINNYAQGNSTRYYGKTINYTLSASIVQVGTDEHDNQVITPATGSLPAVLIDGSAMQASYSGSLLAGAARENAYTLTMPRSMLSGTKYYVLLTATPTGSGYSDLLPISALFDLGARTESSATAWHLESTDNRSNAIGGYAGFNFRLSGSGSGTITLGWDGSMLEINKIFKDAVGATVPASVPSDWTGFTAIEFDVNAATGANSYDIQFYPASEGVVSSWSDVAVRMVFSES